MNSTDSDRFWSKVNIKDENDCWNWTAARTVNDYGIFRILGRWVLAHRYVMLGQDAYYSNDRKNNIVLHLCDNSLCCNPKHLKLGTQKENLAQRKPFYNKGNTGKGRLTTEDVKKIKELYNVHKASYETIGREYSLSRGTIWKIIKGLIYKGIE